MRGLRRWLVTTLAVPLGIATAGLAGSALVAASAAQAAAASGPGTRTAASVSLPAHAARTYGDASGASRVTASNYCGCPLGITSGPDGALWFTDVGNETIGRITTSGTGTSYTGSGINFPGEITAGPDGTLWFTNWNTGTIGRITTSGTVTIYTGPGINEPNGITAGPDGALWFTNYGNNSIGRITTSGTVTNYADPSINKPWQITAGPDGALWFTNTAATHRRSGGSPPAGRSPTTHSPWRVNHTGSQRVPTEHCGSPIHSRHRADDHHRDGHLVLREHPTVRDHVRAGRGTVVHRHQQQLHRADHHQRDGHHLHRPQHQ